MYIRTICNALMPDFTTFIYTDMDLTSDIEEGTNVVHTVYNSMKYRSYL